MGGVRASEATPTSRSGKVEKKPSKWRLFHGKTSNEKSKPVVVGDDGAGGKQVTFGKQTKQVKEKKSKKISKKVHLCVWGGGSVVLVNALVQCKTKKNW